MSTTSEKAEQTRALVPVEASRAQSDGQTYVFTASTSAVARDRGVLDAEGWEYDARSLPPFLWAHNHSAPPIGQVTGIEKRSDGLRVSVRFVDKDILPFADTVRRLYESGVMKAVSVGFRTLENRELTDAERSAGARWASKRQELFEVSACNVPVDKGAVLVAVRSAVESGVLGKTELDSIRGQLGAIEPWGPVVAEMETLLAVKPATTSTETRTVTTKVEVRQAPPPPAKQDEGMSDEEMAAEEPAKHPAEECLGQCREILSQLVAYIDKSMGGAKSSKEEPRSGEHLLGLRDLLQEARGFAGDAEDGAPKTEPTASSEGSDLYELLLEAEEFAGKSPKQD